MQSLCELLLQDNLAVLHEAFAQEKQNWIELVGCALELQVKIVYDCLKCQLDCPVMQSRHQEGPPPNWYSEREAQTPILHKNTQIQYNSASAATFAGQAM